MWTPKPCIQRYIYEKQLYVSQNSQAFSNVSLFWPCIGKPLNHTVFTQFQCIFHMFQLSVLISNTFSNRKLHYLWARKNICISKHKTPKWQLTVQLTHSSIFFRCLLVKPFSSHRLPCLIINVLYITDTLFLTCRLNLM